MIKDKTIIKYEFLRICGIRKDCAEIIKTWDQKQIVRYLYRNKYK